jgi:2-phospho-L-lactate guanylyltransferase (CobY/MobA/RfbA family)
MGDLRAKVAYLEGLAEGLGLDQENREGRLLAGLIDVVADLADAIEEVSEAQVDLADYVQDVEDDLNDALEDDAEIDDDDEEIAFICCPNCGSEMDEATGATGATS